MTRAHSWPPGAPQHLGPGEDRTVAETLSCAPSGPDTAELAPGASACRTHPRSVLTNSWGCRGTLGSIWMHFWVQGCVSPTPVCPFESDKSVSIQGPERPIRDRLGITAPGFRQGCGLCKDRPTSALLLCHLKLSTRSMDEPTDQGRQEGANATLAPLYLCVEPHGQSPGLSVSAHVLCGAGGCTHPAHSSHFSSLLHMRGGDWGQCSAVISLPVTKWRYHGAAPPASTPGPPLHSPPDLTKTPSCPISAFPSPRPPPTAFSWSSSEFLERCIL